jgi:hypothetical protein
MDFSQEMPSKTVQLRRLHTNTKRVKSTPDCVKCLPESRLLSRAQYVVLSVSLSFQVSAPVASLLLPSVCKYEGILHSK